MIYKVEKDWITMSGLRAVVIKGTDCFIHRCGYVAVDERHPLYGKDYTDKCECLSNLLKATKELPMKNSPINVFLAAARETDDELLTPEIVFRVHGGLTYAGGDGKYPIEEAGIWWFGFDCAHFGDATAYSPGVMRSREYVEKECEQLANQLSTLVQDELAH